MINSTNLLPGMVDDNVEMFVQNNDLKVIHQGKILEFSELPFSIISILEEAIESDHDAINALMQMHPDSKINRTKQFAMCRLGGLDYQADIINNTLQDGEYWPCPIHGNCAHEGILCKLPVINGQRLSKVDVRLLQLTATDKTNEVIAEIIELPLGAFHKIKKELYAFLGIQTKQEGTLLSKLYNLL